MKLTKLLRDSVTVVGTVLVVASMATNGISAAAFNGVMHYDNFNNLYLKPDHRSDWWVINYDDGQRVEDYCTPNGASCVQPVSQQGEHFVRLSMTPRDADHVAQFTNATFAELRTDYSANLPGLWEPTVGHSITFETVARWGDNYKQDGSGGAIGTSGIWLWNSPFSLDSSALTPQTAFGFNWTTKGSAGGFIEGLKVNVVYNSIPLLVYTPTFAVDMNNWVDFKAVWSVDSNGVQSVNFWINDQFVGGSALPEALPALSVDVWNDNEDYQFTANGFQIGYKNPTQYQNMDVNSITVRKD